MLRTTPRWLLGLRAALRPSQTASKDGIQGQNVEIPLKPTMAVVVRRFQGVYECGCKADPLEGPENCEIHDKPKKYLVEEAGEYSVEVKKED